MESGRATVDAYLAALPDERRAPIQAVRQVVLEHLPEGFEEVMQRVDDLALDVLGEAIARTSVDEFLAAYERSRATR